MLEQERGLSEIQINKPSTLKMFARVCLYRLYMNA